MAEVNIKTRLSLRYDTLANWNSANPVLNKGEVAVVAIPSTATGENTYGQDTKPSILFKVGDGTSNFKALPYASGRAADVYAWAKASTKPTYTASEVGAAEEDHIHTGDSIHISGQDSDTLEDWAEAIATNIDSRALSSDVYTKSQVDTKIQEIQGALEADTNTQYKLEWSTSEKLLVFSSKDIGGNWTVVTKLTPGSFTLSSAAGTDIKGKTFDEVLTTLANDLGNLTDRVGDAETEIDDLNEETLAIRTELGNGTLVPAKAESANKAIADKNGRDITTTYATKTELSTELGKKLDSSKVVQEVTDSTAQDAVVQWSGLESYIAKQDRVLQDAIDSLAQDVDEIDYDTVGAAAASHTHTKSEITDFAHTHDASQVNYLGNKISAASGSTIQVAVDAVYDGLNTHTSSKANPHGVTAAQVGTYTSQKIEELVQNAITDSQDLIRDHTEASNPHNITKSTVGLGNVLNVASYAKTETMSTTEIGTAIADAEGRASEYADDVVGTLRTAVTNGTVVAGKASKDGNGAVIADTYATKTELSTGLSGKADSSALSQQVSRLEGLIDDAVEDVEEIANGKTRTYVLSYTGSDSSFNNSIFNSNSDTIDLTQSHKIGLIDGTTLNQSSGLKVGDVFLVKETNVPDRWVMSVNGSGTFTLAKMETAKVDLTPYVLASTIINGKTLEDDIDLTGDDIGIANDDGTSIADKFSEVDDYIDSFIDGSKVVGHAGFADSADQAVADGLGNVIVDTYATKAALNALSSSVNSVEHVTFYINSNGTVTIDTESEKIQSKINSYFSAVYSGDLKTAQIVERGLKFALVDDANFRWQGHISGFAPSDSAINIKFECDGISSTSPWNGFDITVCYKPGAVVYASRERRFSASDVYILNGGNAAGAYN